MPTWHRHPRYALGAFLVLVTIFYFLNPFDSSQTLLVQPPPSINYGDHDLPARLERSERIYTKVLNARQGLIRKFGPTPIDVAMYVALDI